jgi:hypothetical protein
MIAGTFNASYEYAIIRYMPDAERGESANVGLVVKKDKRQIVLWNERFCPPSFLKSRTWKTQNMRKWRDFYKEELTVLLPNDENASMRLSSDYWDSIRARCREGYVLGESSFIFNNDPGRFEEEISSIAQRLFSQLVEKDELGRSSVKNIIKSFIAKNHFLDGTHFRYPVQTSYRLEGKGIYINLPFYQKNGISRAIWPLNAQPSSITPSPATIERLGRMFVAKSCFQNLGTEAEYIFLTSKTLSDDDINVIMIEQENGRVFSVESEDAHKYLREACDPFTLSY